MEPRESNGSGVQSVGKGRLMSEEAARIQQQQLVEMKDGMNLSTTQKFAYGGLMRPARSYPGERPNF